MFRVLMTASVHLDRLPTSQILDAGEGDICRYPSSNVPPTSVLGCFVSAWIHAYEEAYHAAYLDTKSALVFGA